MFMDIYSLPTSARKLCTILPLMTLLGCTSPLINQNSTDSSTSRLVSASGSDWTIGEINFLPAYHLFVDSLGDMNVAYVDVDGDGKKDLLFNRYVGYNNIQSGALKNTGSGWQALPSSYIPPYQLMVDPLKFKTSGTKFLDLDGDGLEDMLFFRWWEPSGYQRGAYKNTGTGWVSMTSNYYSPYHLSVDSIGDLAVKLLDLTGDGLKDMLYYRQFGTSFQKGAWANTGYGWTQLPDYYIPDIPFFIDDKGEANNRVNRRDMGVEVVDVDGDNFEDLVYKNETSSGQFDIRVYKNMAMQGGGWMRIDDSYAPPCPTYIEGIGKTFVTFIDINGDGRKDALYYRNQDPISAAAYRNDSTSTNGIWTKIDSFKPLYPIFDDNYGSMGVGFVDVNGDNKYDMVINRHLYPLEQGTYIQD